MGRLRDMFGGPSLGKLVLQAQRKMAAEDFDQARKIVQKGLREYPGAEALQEMELVIRRAQARVGIRSLKERIERDNDARAYEQLISLYLELGLPAEARTEANAYAEAHAELDSAHLLLGEMSLQAFFEDLRATDGRTAYQRLLRAATLNQQSVKPRYLLAELFYCLGADVALARVIEELRAIMPDDAGLEALKDRVPDVDASSPMERFDGLFEGIEVQGALVREPTTWPLRTARVRSARFDEERAQRVAEMLVSRGSPLEVVLLQRSGTVVANARASSEAPSDEATGASTGLVDVSRTVARTVSHHAREFDLGRFRRCTIQGPFGIVAVGEIGGVVTGARWRPNPEPQRLWDRIAVNLEGALGKKR